MILKVAPFLVLLMGILVCLGSAFGLYAPGRLIGVVTQIWEHKSGMYVAVAARLVLGGALILVAPDTSFPTVFRVFGGLAIIAAVAIPIIGRATLGRLIHWMGHCPPFVLRLWLLAGIAFGVVMIVGVLGGTG